MNHLTSQQRKLVYLGALLLLMVPIISLGRPSSGADDSSGGKLAELRTEHELGESNLGAVDPSSATMNLVLVGLRGIAVNLLWIEAIENQKKKNWAELKTNVDSIILLQPHFLEVWRFQSWNLAYNVSNEWDLTEDRYYWVKEGIKFGMRGVEQNKKNPWLYHWVGKVFGQRIGNHDASKYFRQFFNPSDYANEKDKRFVGDPDERRRTGKISPDLELNPNNLDNYLVSKDWYHRANATDRIQKRYEPGSSNFRQMPAHSQMLYGNVLQREGRFSETGRMLKAWETAFKDWTDTYENGKEGFGQELFTTKSAGKVRLEATTDAELRQLMTLDKSPGKFSIEAKRRVIQLMRSTGNYDYWRKRAEVEQERERPEELPKMFVAHRDIFNGKAALLNWEPIEAIQKLESGLFHLLSVVEKHKVLQTEDSTVEEILIAVLTWQHAKQLLGEFVPRAIPVFRQSHSLSELLKTVWNGSPATVHEMAKQILERELRVHEKR